MSLPEQSAGRLDALPPLLLGCTSFPAHLLEFELRHVRQQGGLAPVGHRSRYSQGPLLSAAGAQRLYEMEG